jgi:hypothetical protein
LVYFEDPFGGKRKGDYFIDNFKYSSFFP